MSYTPIKSLDSLKGRPKYNAITGNVFGPPQFETISDLSILDYDPRVGNFIVGFNIFGVPYVELEATYQSGYTTIPDEVKVACGLIIAQLAKGNDGGVKSKKDFDFAIEYFGSSMVTPEVESLLAPYIHHPMR
jgi:hypothetical protein